MTVLIIERVRIKDFRSLVDLEFSDPPNVILMASASGSGCPMSFVSEMVSWILHPISLPSSSRNDHLNISPNHRIAEIMPRYNKVKRGGLLAEKTGIEKICAQRPKLHKRVQHMASLKEHRSLVGDTDQAIGCTHGD